MKKEVVLDLGVASAYGDAVAAGYTGTKEEFSEMLANLRTYHDEAVSAGDSAIDAAMRATSAVETIQEIADDAEQSKTDAAASATAAEQSAQAAADTLAQLTTDTTLTITGKPADAAATGSALSELKRDFAGVPLTASGDPVVISDSAGEIPARELILNLEPQQDLRGYANPWIGGAGKNIIPFPYAETTGTSKTISGVTFTIYSNGSVRISGTATGNIYFRLYGGLKGDAVPAPSWLGVGNYNVFGGVDDNISIDVYFYDATSNTIFRNTSATYTAMAVTAELLENTVAFGAFIRVASGVTANHMIYPMITAASNTDATFAPYENICPLTGYTGVEVTRNGKNLLPALATGSTTISNVTYTVNADGTISVKTGTGGATAQSQFYILGSALEDANVRFDKNIIVSSGVIGSASTYRLVVWATTLAGGEYNYLIDGPEQTVSAGFTIRKMAIRVMSGASADITIKPMIRYTNFSDATYEPYISTTYPITFPTEAGTVYGGTLNPKTGELKVDRKWLNVAAAGWEQIVADGRFYVSVPDCADVNNDTPAVGLFCSIGKTTSLNKLINRQDYGVALSASKSLSIRIDGVTTYETSNANERRQILVANGTEIVYPIATPITYQLTPAEVELLTGSNTIWMDADGTIDLIYNGDIKTYIDSKVAELQALILENNG